MAKRPCIFVFSALAVAVSVLAEENDFFAFPDLPDEPPPAATLSLTLEECVTRAFEVNYDVLIEEQEVNQANARALEARGAFEPELFGEGGYTGQSKEGVEDTESAELGVRTRLVTGTDLALSGNFNSASDPESPDSGRARIALTQPLLRRVGIRANKAPLIIARRNQEVSVWNLTQRMIDTATIVQNAYWDLVANRESLLVQRESLRFAQELETLVRQRSAVGLVPDSDIVEAQANAFASEADVVQAGETVRSTEDQLKEQLAYFEDPALWNATLIPTTEAALPREEVTFLPALRLALENRPDYRADMLRLKNDDLALYVAKNALLPQLDLVADTDLTKEGTGPTTAVDALTGGDEQVWSVFLRLSIPLGNKEARGSRDQAAASREQRLLRLKRLELQIIREVRRAVDAVQTSRELLNARSKAVEAEQLKLDNEQEKLSLGKSDTDTVVRFIQSLNGARLRYIRAVVRYNQALVRLDQAQGTTLQRFGMVVEE